ncbi:MAG: glycosyltransferase, partial [Cytophagales bacterium]|nr:glycosyltransferase [Cytophagales bacterium]
HFFKQLRFFGRARINLTRYYPDELKLIHFLPALFFLGIWSLPLVALWHVPLALVGLGVLALWALLVGFDALWRSRNGPIAIMAVAAAFVQLYAYGWGLWWELGKKLLRGKTKGPDYISLYQ